MKKTLNLLTLFLCIFVLSSCVFIPSDDNGMGGSCTVTFVVDGKETTKTFLSGISYPEVPEKENYIFSGWYYDEAGKSPAYLGTFGGSSVKLYAVWRYDYETALSKIFSEHIKAAVGINVEHRKNGFSFSGTTKKVTGSGVIFDEDQSYYYVLTNHHVTEEEIGYTSRTISVIDCYGTEHTAALVGSMAEYDLSLLRVSKGTSSLTALSFAKATPEIGDTVIAIGQPNGIDNSVTFGEMTKFDKISGDDEKGNLDFSVIWHDAPMDHGSSGGVLINGDFEIIGINYAIGTSKDNDNFLCGFAVGVDKINEFLSKYKAE